MFSYLSPEVIVKCKGHNTPQVFEFLYKSEQQPSVLISLAISKTAGTDVVIKASLQRNIGGSYKVLNIFHLYLCMALILLSFILIMDNICSAFSLYCIDLLNLYCITHICILISTIKFC